MPGTIVAVAASAVTMLVLDGIWLSLMASRLYKPELGGLLRDKFLPAPAVLFYIVYLGGIAILAVWSRSQISPGGRSSPRSPPLQGPRRGCGGPHACEWVGASRKWLTPHWRPRSCPNRPAVAR